MARDHRRLHVFSLADSLLIAVYRTTKALPASERFGLQDQLRRSALSAATNIVEGSARRTTREYVNFLNLANGSAAEAHYLLTVAHRLDYVPESAIEPLLAQYAELQRGLQAMMNTLEQRG
ncbi:MAG: four helix bundle protein [Vicinamibacterales bacterium]